MQDPAHTTLLFLEKQPHAHGSPFLPVPRYLPAADLSQFSTDNETIHKTNLEYRQIDRATDVLSFPMVDFPAPADYSVLEDDDSCFDPESGELLLGDIMISIPKAVEQAEAYGHSVKREYAFLVAHSMLHLLGYAHMVDEERIVMEQKQEKALQQLQIGRD